MKIVQKKKSIHNWPLFEVEPLDKWVSDSGKFILIGDAAHAMVPYLSMGMLRFFSLMLYRHGTNLRSSVSFQVSPWPSRMQLH